MKHCCRNCHFLAQEENWSDGRIMYCPYPLKMRTHSNFQRDPPLCCFRGIWNNFDTRFTPRESLLQLVSKQRNGSCYFWPFKEGMSCEAVESLQTKESVEKNTSYAKKSYCIAIVVVIMTAISLLYMIAKDILF